MIKIRVPSFLHTIKTFLSPHKKCTSEHTSAILKFVNLNAKEHP